LRSGGGLSLSSLVRNEHCEECASNHKPLGVGELSKTSSAKPNASFASPGLLSGGGSPDPGGHGGRPGRHEGPVRGCGEKWPETKDVLACAASRPFVMRPGRSAGSRGRFVRLRRAPGEPGAEVFEQESDAHTKALGRTADYRFSRSSRWHQRAFPRSYPLASTVRTNDLGSVPYAAMCGSSCGAWSGSAPGSTA
jgi:hypothetical protein